MNERVTFLLSSKSRYDPRSSQLVDGSKDGKTIPCKVMDLGMDRSMQLFGNYEKERKVIFVQRSYGTVGSKVRVGDSVYRILAIRQNGTVMYVEVDSSVKG